jgi:molecular chaperone GrpE
VTDPTTPGVPEEGVTADVSADTTEDAINTESVNDGEGAAPHAGATPAGAGAPAPGVDEIVDAEVVESEVVDDDTGDAEASDASGSGADVHPDTVLAAERLADLQRLQAEYVNYKRRVDRDRALVQERVVRDVLESVLPVLDDVHAAREHGELSGPFAAIADKLEATLARYGLARFGAKGEEFDPQHHEALMHAPWPVEDDDLPAGATGTTVVTVLQPGYRAGEQVLRPARVAVADPD